MTKNCRAPLWYSKDISITDAKLSGVKALRECEGIKISRSEVSSTEFGWFSSDISILDSTVSGEYFMLRAENLNMSRVKMQGKYSFQYVRNSLIEDCYLDTKDAFWHAKNVTVRNCTVKGEYLAWYSEGLTLENCTIIGTQPLCYCKDLRIINCKMEACDLSFERSDVVADVRSHVDSIKNVRSGSVTVDSVGEIITDDPDALGSITVRASEDKSV